jgi:ABC-2 type transport system permease protein
VMTTMQVLLMVSFTVGSQILPRLVRFSGLAAAANLNVWWVKLIPAAWFAAFDDAVAGSRSGTSWMLAGVGVVVTIFILWLAFSRLSEVYESGWQSLNESTKPKVRQQSQFRFIYALSGSAPLRLVLRDPVSRASFQLVSAYLFRDRDTKLRLYPGVAPMMVMPIMLLFTSSSFKSTGDPASAVSGFSGFTVALSAVYMCILPLTALNLLKFSQQWRAAEVFVAAPIAGPGPILQGARVAVMLFLGLPLVLALVAYVVFTRHFDYLWLVLAGLIAMPVYAMIPGIMENATPLSNPIEEAKSTSNFPIMMLSMFGSFCIAGVATFASAIGYLAYFLIAEAVAAVLLCLAMKKLVARHGWRTYD